MIVRDGEIADSYYSLIKPEPEYYSYWNTRVHGLTQEDTIIAVTTSPCITMPWQMPKPVPRSQESCYKTNRETGYILPIKYKKA